jgi:hypothetical protein
MEASILIPPNWHIITSLLVIGATLAQNPTSKYDQPIVYAYRLLNKVK